MKYNRLPITDYLENVFFFCYARSGNPILCSIRPQSRPLIQEMLSIEQVILDAFIGLKRSRFLESLALLLILLLVLSNMNTDDFTILFTDYLMLVYGFKLAGKNVYELKLDFCA